jgi:hypothetical protein
VPLSLTLANGKEKALANRYNRMVELIKRYSVDPKIQTLVISSATKFVDVLINATLAQQNKDNIEEYKDGRQFWGFFARNSAFFFETLTKMRKHIVLEAHEKINKDPTGSVVYPTKVNWPGQVGQIIGAYFTDVWRCDMSTTGFGANATSDYVLRTTPDYRYELKNSFSLPATFKFDWKVIEEKLNATTK